MPSYTLRQMYERVARTNPAFLDVPLEVALLRPERGKKAEPVTVRGQAGWLNVEEVVVPFTPVFVTAKYGCGDNDVPNWRLRLLVVSLPIVPNLNTGVHHVAD